MQRGITGLRQPRKVMPCLLYSSCTLNMRGYGRVCGTVAWCVEYVFHLDPCQNSICLMPHSTIPRSAMIKNSVESHYGDWLYYPTPWCAWVCVFSVNEFICDSVTFADNFNTFNFIISVISGRHRIGQRDT